MNQLNKCCTVCDLNFIRKQEHIYKILEDISVWDSSIDITDNPYICEHCLADLVLDIEKYINIEPSFRFNFN